MENKKIIYKSNNYVVRNSNESDNSFATRILTLLLKDIYNMLKKENLYDDIDLRFKFLYICKKIIEDSIKENDNVPIIDKISSLKINKKDVLLEYSKYISLDKKTDAKEVLSYYIDQYTDSYEGALDKDTVKELYTKKYDRIFEKIDENNVDIDKVKKQIVNNFYSYKNTIRGYERKEFKKYLLRIKELMKTYESTLSKEDAMIIRHTISNLILNYISGNETDSFDTYFVKKILSFDLKQAKEVSLKENKYKDEYKFRNVLVK